MKWKFLENEKEEMEEEERKDEEEEEEERAGHTGGLMASVTLQGTSLYGSIYLCVNWELLGVVYSIF